MMLSNSLLQDLSATSADWFADPVFDPTNGLVAPPPLRRRGRNATARAIRTATNLPPTFLGSGRPPPSMPPSLPLPPLARRSWIIEELPVWRILVTVDSPSSHRSTRA